MGSRTIELDQPTMLSLYGISVFVLIFGGILWANSRRWRYLAQKYAGSRTTTMDQRSMQNAILVGMNGYNTLHGIVKIGVHQQGMSLKILPPFSIFHSPLFIPFHDISGWATTWYLNAPSVELQLRQAPDVKIIMPAKQAEWVSKFSGHKMALHKQTPPGGKAGRGAYAFVLLHAGLVLGMIGWLAFNYLSK